MKPRVLLDEDVQVALADALRRRRYDVVHVQEVMRKGESDASQLEYSVQNQRCILSYNQKDFMQLHNDYCEKDQTHYGIIVSRHRHISMMFHRMMKFLHGRDTSAIENNLFFYRMHFMVALPSPYQVSESLLQSQPH